MRMIRMRGMALAVGAALAGSPAGAVVGGAAEDGPAARQSVMVLTDKGGVCSAVVVAPDAVLTAAHCVAGGAERRVHWRDEAGQPVLAEPRAVAVHPGYDAKAVAARRRSIDLALVRLRDPLPARFAAAALSAAAPPAGASATVGGYGNTREGDPRSMGTFTRATLQVVEPHGPSRILLWLKGAGAGACQGDSGGPIRAGSGVVAVASWSTGPGARRCGDLTQGVLLGPQRAWIDGTLGGWGRQAAWE